MRFGLVCLIALCSASLLIAQEPVTPTQHHEWLKKEAGNWTGTMKLYQEPGSDPVTIPIKERNRLIGGGLWLVTDFECGEMVGHGQLGYDPHKKAYVGTWIDNMTSSINVMTGTLNEAKDTMTTEFVGTEPNGEKRVSKAETKISDSGRTFTMHVNFDGAWHKAFVIEYKRSDE